MNKSRTSHPLFPPWGEKSADLSYLLRLAVGCNPDFRRIILSVTLTRRILHRQFYIRQQIADPVNEPTDGMFFRRMAKIIGRHVYINLRAGNLSMSEQIAKRYYIHSGFDEVGCESVTQAVWRNTFWEMGFACVSPYALIHNPSR